MLDQETLCSTISMHKDQCFNGGKTLLRLLKNKDKKIAVETFLKFGISSKSECQSDEYVNKLVDHQFKDYRSIENLKNKSYVQVIEYTSIKNALITLADDKSDVKVFDSDYECYKKQRNRNKNSIYTLDNHYHGTLNQQNVHVDGCDKSYIMPTLLHPSPTGQTDLAGNDLEWKMDQVNPDPMVN